MGRFTPMGVEAVVKNLNGYISDLHKMEGSTRGVSGALGTIAVGAATAGAAVAALAVAAAAVAGAGLFVAIQTGIRETSEAEQVMATFDATLRAVASTSTIAENASFMLAWRQGKLKDALAAAGSEMTEQERSAFMLAWQQGNLEKAIAAVGQVSTVTRDEAEGLAMKYRDLAGGSDEAVLSAETVLLRFSQLRGDAFEPALQVALDLAAALGTDVPTAASMLGRALEVPGEGLRALKAAGIVLTDQQKDMIDRMVETGDVAGAQTFLLDALTGTIGGTAAAAADTFSGRMTIMRNHVLEATEGLGKSLMPTIGQFITQFIDPAVAGVEDFLAVLGPKLGDVSGDVVDAFGETAGAVGELMASLGIEPSAEGIADFIAGIVSGAADLIGAVGQVANWLREELPGAIAIAQEWLQPLIDGVMALFGAMSEDAPEAQTALQGFLDFWSSSIAPTLAIVAANVKGIIEGLGGVFQQLAGWWEQHGQTVIDVVGFVFRFVTATIAGALALITGIINAALAVINGDWGAAWDAILGALGGFFNAALGIVGENLGSFITTWRTNFEMAGTIVRTVFDRVKKAVVDVIQSIIRKVAELAKKITDALPDWLIPHSPTPFEIGVRGIRRELGRMTAEVRVPAMASLMPAMAMAQAGPSRTNNVSIGSVNNQGIGSGVFDRAMRDWLGG